MIVPLNRRDLRFELDEVLHRIASGLEQLRENATGRNELQQPDHAFFAE